jgi:protoporphyrin/coproporphyrin ferrochelatase
MKKKAVLLVNLGSPDSTSVPDVRKYLREFLMDGRVIDAPWPIRFAIVNFSILPKRPHESAEAYKNIWLPEGSPLILTSRKVHSKLQDLVNVPVELAMRYQNPSIPAAIEKLSADGIQELLLIPLFPHYAMSSYETAVERVKEVIASQGAPISVQVLPPYYADPDYIEALVASAAKHLSDDYDHLLFSFHGIPERHLRKSDPTGSHCMKVRDCCSKPSPAHATCYRHQCFQTMQEFVKKAGVPAGKYSVAFQSRLGRDPWLQPYTDTEISQMPARGVKKLLVICPAFVSDCLETIEEIGMRGREAFLHAGGTELSLIPCLNEHPLWIRTLAKWVERFATENKTHQTSPALAS